MPILEWWDLCYRQIPGAAQVVDRMSRGVQRGLRTVLRQNGRGQRPWSPVQPSPPRPNQVLWQRALRSSTRVCRTAHLEQVEHPRAVERPPSLHVFQHHRHHKRRAPPAAKWFRSPCLSQPGRSSSHRRAQVQRLKHRPRRPKSLATGSRKRKPKLKSDPLLEEHGWVPAAEHIPKKKKKRKVVPAPSSGSDSSKLPIDTVQDVKALATELAAGLKDGDEEKAIRAESAHASALEVNPNNDDWRLRIRANSCDSGPDGRPTPRVDGSLWTVLMANHVWPWVPRGKPRGGPPGPKRGNIWSSFPRSRRRRAMQPEQRGQLLQSRTAQASVTPTLLRRR